MTNELLKYSLQLSMLSMLLSKHLLSDIEYKKIKIKPVSYTHLTLPTTSRV